MIAKVARRGTQMGGLVRYLLGPGRGVEDPAKGDVHVDQRVVAKSSDIADVPVGVSLDGDQAQSLGSQMGLYAELFPEACPRQGAVYHVVFSLPPGEHLGDEQWAEIAQDTARVLHLEKPNGAVGSWAAFCHGPGANGNEHMHFAASLVRSDGSLARSYLGRGYAELHQVARSAEDRYGLSILAGRDHGSVPVAGRAEQAACARRGRNEPDRAVLAGAVRAAAAGAGTEAEFPEQVRAQGLLIRPRYERGGQDRVVGYSVALPVKETTQERQTREAAGRDKPTPVWFGGGRLGRDLTLPALRRQWGSTAEDQGSAVRAWGGPAPRRRFDTSADAARAGAQLGAARAWEGAASRLADLRKVSEEPGGLAAGEWRVLAREAAGAVHGLARRVEIDGPGPLGDAARCLARAAQRPVGTPTDLPVDDTRSRAMRGVAAVCAQQRLAGSGKNAEAWLRVLAELARLAQMLQRAAAARDELRVETTLSRQASASLASAQQSLTEARPDHLHRRPGGQTQTAGVDDGRHGGQGRHPVRPEIDRGRRPDPARGKDDYGR